MVPFPGIRVLVRETGPRYVALVEKDYALFDLSLGRVAPILYILPNLRGQITSKHVENAAVHSLLNLREFNT